MADSEEQKKGWLGRRMKSPTFRRALEREHVVETELTVDDKLRKIYREQFIEPPRGDKPRGVPVEGEGVGGGYVVHPDDKMLTRDPKYRR